jgi:hypothetical protein
MALAAILAPAAAPAPAVAQTESSPQEQRRVILELREQVRVLNRTIEELLASLGPGALPPRERPTLPECPWPQETGAVRTVAASPSPTGVVDPPRPRIPDCAPPGWKAPGELAAFVASPLPEDRPRPIVEDYLDYIITLPPAEIVERFQLDTTYYKKYADANGYPILTSDKVPNAALAIVRDQVNYMLGDRPDIRAAMVAHGSRLVIMAETEYTMDIPEQRNWIVPRYLDPRLTPGERASYYEPGGLAYQSPEAYWNHRARGMGGTLISCAEENVLGYYGTRYWGSNICVHEFAHAIMGAGIGNVDPEWFQEIVDAYKDAKAQCRATTNGYAGNTFNEYWAIGLEWYIGNGGRDRAALEDEDPRLYELIARLIPEHKTLPVLANVAARSRQEMEELVRERNPEWWQREQERRQAVAAARSRTRSGGGAAPAPCVPMVD